jgi:hypothetical protein
MNGKRDWQEQECQFSLSPKTEKELKEIMLFPTTPLGLF